MVINKKNILLACVVIFFYVTSIGYSQTSCFWLPDSSASRVDVGTKGSATPNPLSIGSPSLTTIPDSLDWNVTDEFIPSWNEITSGDFDVSLVVGGQTDSVTWAKGGLFYTDSANSDSSIFSVVALTKTNGVVFNSGGNGSTQVLTKSAGVTLPVWVRLAKVDSTVTGYYKTEEAGSWIELGNTVVSGSSSAGVATMLMRAGS